jgi:cell division septation protein DedD
MKDNNLDDLIIDSTRVKTNGSKNALTIIVLLVIILLIAILLTKIMIDKPQVSPLADINKTELANNDLLLDTNTSDTLDLNESNVTAQPEEVNGSTSIVQVVKQESQKMQEVVKKELPKVEKKVKSIKEVIKKELPKVEEKVESVKEVVKKELPKVEEKVESIKEVVKKELPKVEKKVDTPSGSYYIQAGAFGSSENVNKVETAIKNSGFAYKSLKREKGTKILVGPFSSQAKAEAALVVIKSKVNKDAFIVKP